MVFTTAMVLTTTAVVFTAVMLTATMTLALAMTIVFTSAVGGGRVVIMRQVPLAAHVIVHVHVLGLQGALGVPRNHASAGVVPSPVRCQRPPVLVAPYRPPVLVFVVQAPARLVPVEFHCVLRHGFGSEGCVGPFVCKKGFGRDGRGFLLG